MLILRPGPLSTHPVLHVLAARDRERHGVETGAAARAAAARLGVELGTLSELTAPRAPGRARRERLLRKRLRAFATRIGAELHPLVATPLVPGHVPGHPDATTTDSAR